MNDGIRCCVVLFANELHGFVLQILFSIDQEVIANRTKQIDSLKTALRTQPMRLARLSSACASCRLLLLVSSASISNIVCFIFVSSNCRATCNKYNHLLMLTPVLKSALRPGLLVNISSYKYCFFLLTKNAFRHKLSSAFCCSGFVSFVLSDRRISFS